MQVARALLGRAASISVRASKLPRLPPTSGKPGGCPSFSLGPCFDCAIGEQSRELVGLFPQSLFFGRAYVPRGHVCSWTRGSSPLHEAMHISVLSRSAPTPSSSCLLRLTPGLLPSPFRPYLAPVFGHPRLLALRLQWAPDPQLRTAPSLGGRHPAFSAGFGRRPDLALGSRTRSHPQLWLLALPRLRLSLGFISRRLHPSLGSPFRLQSLSRLLQSGLPRRLPNSSPTDPHLPLALSHLSP